MIAERFGGVILHVVFGNRLRVEVLPRNVESIEAASRRAAAATRSERFDHRVGPVLRHEVRRVLELDHLRVREQLAPLVHEDRLEDAGRACPRRA